MARRGVYRNLIFFGLGISLILIVSSLNFLAGDYPRNVFVLGSGVIILCLSLASLQLSMWREGDTRRERVGTAIAPPHVRPAPPQLASPRMRGIWEHMEETRKLMDLKQERAHAVEKEKEKVRLGLPEEEEILFMAESCSLPLWPIALISLSFLLASAYLSDARISAFFCLFMGLAGLLLLTAMKGRKKYYLTNYRVLARTRSILGRTSRWSAMRYSDVHTGSLQGGFASAKLELEGGGETVDIKGVTRIELQAAAKILRQRLPVGVVLNGSADRAREVMTRKTSEL
jgi:hypothetical protein